MEKRTCYNCGNKYAIVRDDPTRAYNERSPWLEDVCRRCVCYLRRYHKWTVTDSGVRICADCFKTRRPLATVVAALVNRRKRDAVP